MVLPTISLTEAGAFTALRSFLLATVAPGTEVIRAEVNRVPEPIGADFIIMTPIRQERLETNEVTYYDNIVTGSIAGTVLTVTSVQRGSLTAGLLLLDKNKMIVTNTIILSQLSGSVGGTGTYRVSTSQNVVSGLIYAGQRADLVGVEWTVQLDIHGPASGDSIRIIDTLFKSEAGIDLFRDTGFAVVPLYCGPARQMPFLNAEAEYEYRWTLDAAMQISPVIGTSQQFAEQLQMGLVDIEGGSSPGTVVGPVDIP